MPETGFIIHRGLWRVIRGHRKNGVQNLVCGTNFYQFSDASYKSPNVYTENKFLSYLLLLYRTFMIYLNNSLKKYHSNYSHNTCSIFM